MTRAPAYPAPLSLLAFVHAHVVGSTSRASGAVGLNFDTKLTPDPFGKGYRLNGKKYYSTGSLR